MDTTSTSFGTTCLQPAISTLGVKRHAVRSLSFWSISQLWCDRAISKSSISALTSRVLWQSLVVIRSGQTCRMRYFRLPGDAPSQCMKQSHSRKEMIVVSYLIINTIQYALSPPNPCTLNVYPPNPTCPATKVPEHRSTHPKHHSKTHLKPTAFPLNHSYTQYRLLSHRLPRTHHHVLPPQHPYLRYSQTPSRMQ